jgi:chromate transporter
MKDSSGTLLTLALQFSLLSFLAIGGAITALPEMHRQAVDVYHWMTSTQFTQLVARQRPGRTC